MSELLGYLPPKLRPLVAGAMMLIAVAGAAYGVAAAAAEKRVAPLETVVQQHMKDQAAREEYDRMLKEAIWTNLQELSAKTGARLEPPPLPKQ